MPFRLKVAAVWVVIFTVLGCSSGIAAGFDTQWIKDNFSFILGGLQCTIIMAVGGIVLAIMLAALGALARISRNPVAYGVSGFYISFFRGTPLIVQMFLIYLALPQVGRNLVGGVLLAAGTGFDKALILTPSTAGMLALGLNYGAYMTEIFRAGIQSVAGGQGEAADALGMTYGQKMRKVVLPQAFRVIIPPTGNEFIAMMKDTALVSFLGTHRRQPRSSGARQLVGKADFKNLEASGRAAALLGADRDLHVLPAPAGGPGRARVRPYVRGTGHRQGGAVRHRRAARPMEAARERPDVVVQIDGLHKSLRPPRGAQGRRHGGAPGRGRRHLRPVRFGEVDPAALRELPRGPDRGHASRSPAMRLERRPPHPAQARADPPAAAPRRDGVPAVQPVPAT